MTKVDDHRMILNKTFGTSPLETLSFPGRIDCWIIQNIVFCFILANFQGWQRLVYVKMSLLFSIFKVEEVAKSGFCLGSLHFRKHLGF